jgi:hypothetical protein
VIKGAYPSQTFRPALRQRVDRQQRDEMIARLRAGRRPTLRRSWLISRRRRLEPDHKRRLLPRGVGLRVYVAATPSGHVVMPGGLTRVSAKANARTISMQRGGSSKDTWVLTDAAVNTFSLLKHSVGKADLVRGGLNLSSRVVENLYWFGRYSERCDKTCRLLRVALARLVDAGDDAAPALSSASTCAVALKLLPVAEADPGQQHRGQGAHARASAAKGADADAICGKEWGDGLAGDIRRLLWVAAQVRERFSLDNWHALNRLQHQLQPTAGCAAAKR